MSTIDNPRFHSSIDLFDETLREGSERAPLATSVAAKCGLAKAITEAGSRTLVVGMFPDVPHNVELLGALLDLRERGELPSTVRFVIISYLGRRMEQTLEALKGLDRDLSGLWVLAIHATSDEWLKHLYPTIREGESEPFDREAWEELTVAEMRALNLDWYVEQLAALKPIYGLDGFIAGLLDAFRADQGHIYNAMNIVRDAGIGQVRLVDTAGTCTPRQVLSFIGGLVTDFPGIDFYGHFHDDFGMATANAVTGLSVGLRGADVAIGGFANRAGHPATAEVVMALRQLYGVELPGFQTERLFSLSRLIEQVYGLLEDPSAPVTGIVTHAVQSGIRTEMLDRSPRIFDELEPADVGSEPIRMFGVRSGQDGMLRIMRAYGAELDKAGIEVSEESAALLYARLVTEWEERSTWARARLQEAMGAYRNALMDAFFTEEAVIDWVCGTTKAVESK